jgi:hypothetical protein
VFPVPVPNPEIVVVCNIEEWLTVSLTSNVPNVTPVTVSVVPEIEPVTDAPAVPVALAAREPAPIINLPRRSGVELFPSQSTQPEGILA